MTGPTGAILWPLISIERITPDIAQATFDYMRAIDRSHTDDFADLYAVVVDYQGNTFEGGVEKIDGKTIILMETYNLDAKINTVLLVDIYSIALSEIV